MALVTGPGSGIGRATATEFAGRGARVVVADVNVDGGEETISMIAVANAIIWLCSAEAAFVTGDAMVVDGGYLAQ